MAAENSVNSSTSSKRDFTLPLVLIAFLIILCAAMLCAAFMSYTSMNYLMSAMEPAACPALDASWHTSMEDPFNDNELNWPLGKEESKYGSSNVRMENGGLIMELASNEGTFYYPSPRFNQSLNEFYLTVQVRNMDQQEFENNEVGVLFRGDGVLMHYFYITDKGKIAVRQYSASQSWSSPRYSKYEIPVVDNEMNKLTVIQSNGQAVYCVNDLIAFTLDNPEYIFGSFGVAASVHQPQKNASFEFDDFKLFAP